MSRSPPPPHQWPGPPGYHPQGSVVGPPPMPNKQGRSPDRERRPSPGYDREAEFRRFQEWEKRNRKSPPPRSPPRSPRRERTPPPNWIRRSPPRSQPPDWPRRSPPPNWRRSPPRYPPPRGRSPIRARSPPRGRTPPRSRSPPRGRSPPRWRPPPPEWDRYRHSRRSPPRYGPPPLHWDNRRPPPPSHNNRWTQHAPPTAAKPTVSKPNGNFAVPPPSATESRRSPEQIEDSTVEESFENYKLPDYDAEVPLGQNYVIAVSGFFCKICHKFYNSESSAKVTHCKSKTHYERYVKWVEDKKTEALAAKQKAESETPAPVPAPATQLNEESLEPPAKTPKLDPQPAEQEDRDISSPELVVKEEVNDSDNEAAESQYDPSEPTVEEDPKLNIKTEVLAMAEPTPKAVENTSMESSSEAEKPSTPSDFLEATLYNFRKMKVSELKENLKKRNLPLHGLKPLLLKRLEKALLAEAAEAAIADAEEIANEEQQDETKEETDVPAEGKDETQAEDTTKESVSQGDTDAVTEIKLVMHESDIEVSNKKTQWITDRELERELSQVSGVMDVKSVERLESQMGKKTIVEWRITLDFAGEFPEEGINFQMDSHQRLPFRAELNEE